MHYTSNYLKNALYVTIRCSPLEFSSYRTKPMYSQSNRLTCLFVFTRYRHLKYCQFKNKESIYYNFMSKVSKNTS